MKETLGAPEAVATDLVNSLTSELAQLRRSLSTATRKLTRTTRTLEGRTQELTEARAALTLLLATLDSTTEGLLAVGYFGRAMHYNTRFASMWGITPERLAGLSECALMAIQLAQVKDPQQFLAWTEAKKAEPDAEHALRLDLADGRCFECRVTPHRVGGKRVGTVTSYQDVSARPLPAGS